MVGFKFIFNFVQGNPLFFETICFVSSIKMSNLEMLAVWNTSSVNF
jgi:hypothetical protein